MQRANKEVEHNSPTMIPRRGHSDPCPLSFAQQRFWFLNQLEPHSSAYNQPKTIRLEGTLRIDVLEKALDAVIERHEVLRTSFPSIDGQPMQVVHRNRSIELSMIDLSQLPRDDHNAELERAILKVTLPPFDLSRDLLLRAALVRLSAAEHLLLLVTHYIVADGWSSGLLFREIAALYEAFSDNRPSPFPALPIQYADFAIWQRQRLQGDILESQLGYWKQRLGGDLPVIELPKDRPRPALQTNAGGSEAITLPVELSVAIKNLARTNRVTLFMTLLAAFQTLIHRYTEHEDIPIGVPMANRTRIEIEGLIGLFANTLVLRTDLSGNPRFQELLRRVRDVVLGAHAHQETPFEKLVEEINPERNLSPTPLFQVMFNLQNPPQPDIHAAGLTFRSIPSPPGVAKFDLNLAMSDRETGITGEIEYNSDLFDPATIRWLMQRYKVLLEGIVANPTRRLSELPIMGESERRQILIEWNDTKADFPTDGGIHRLFEAQAERTPHSTAVAFEDRQLTYSELNGRANQVARHLKALGVGPETLVAICLQRSLETVVALLGILKAGGAYVPLDPLLPKERLALLLEDTQPTALLSERGLIDALPAHEIRQIDLDAASDLITKYDAANLSNGATGGNLAYVLFTSGSTGTPKGVAVEHRQLLNYVHGILQQLDLPAGAGFATVSTFAADLGNTVIFPALCTGGSLHVISQERASDPNALAEYFTHNSIDCLKIVPSHLESLIASSHAEAVLPRGRLVLGGEACSWALIDKVQTLAPDCVIFNHYGPTESTVGVLTYKVDKAHESCRSTTVPMGRPIPNAQIHLLDRHLQPVPPLVPGELYIGGNGITRGYLNRPELTAEKFIPNPVGDEPGARLYRTGDLARYLPDGNIEFLGRIDHQVKIRGFRIELGEIESVLLRHPAVRETVVQVHDETPGDKRLIAYVVPDREPPPPIDELRDFLKEKLPDYMIPSVFVFLDSLPLTPNGKLDHRALPSPDGIRPGSAEAFESARSPLEEIVAGTWAEILRVKRVGIHDNFFSLGGHSLLAVQVISRLREALALEFPLRALLKNPTVAALAAYLEKESQKQQNLQVSPIRPTTRDENLPLSFAQQRLWFLDQLEPGAITYNMARAVRVSGRLDVSVFQRSLDEIVRRHEVLRTTFGVVNDHPVQTIAPIRPFSLSKKDLRPHAEERRVAEAQSLIKEEACRPFDLAKGPLLRAMLIQIAEDDHIFLWAPHHIVFDGWSMGIFEHELWTLYQAFSKGEPSPLPELPIQYADFAHWQRNWLQGEVLEKQLAYWKAQLGGRLPVLELPTDRPRPPVQSFHGAKQSTMLSERLTEALQALALQEGVTLFMVLLAAFKTLLHRYTGQSDIIVGADIANRNRTEIERLIGFFVNLLVIRIDLSGNPTFRELLKRVRHTTLEAYAHQDLPFEKLVEELKPDRDMSRNPIVQALFVMQNLPRQPALRKDLDIKPFDARSEISRFDLALFVGNAENRLTATFKYKTDLFEAKTIARMMRRFDTLLGSIVAHPDAPLSKLEIVSQAEREQQTMEDRTRQESKTASLKAARRNRVDLSRLNLIKSRYLTPEETLPLVIEPDSEEIDMIAWTKDNLGIIETELLKHGALLFRGFSVSTASQFEAFAQAICPELFGEYGDLPREGVTGNVYESTPYPSDRMILFHNESSHMNRWPLKQWFFCVQAAQRGGETPVVDCRKVYRLIDSDIAGKFARDRIMYVRNFTEGLDVSWQDFFKTSDRSAVEHWCRSAGIEFEWTDADGLRIRQVCPAVATHPKTGERVWFNQLQHWHLACLDPPTRQSMLSLFPPEELPRNCYYGDGSVIEDSVMEHVGEVYRKTAVSFPWQHGDILMIDNMLVAHARNPYEGPRKIVVAMGEMVAKESLQPEA